MLLLLIFVAVPIIEIVLFIQVGGAIGTPWTLAIVVITAVVGTILMRTQGLRTIANLQSSLGRGENPVTHIAHGACILIAGVVLLTPGFFTDAVGIALLIPAVRVFVIKYASARIQANSFTVNQDGPRANKHRQRNDDPTIVEAEYIDLGDDPENKDD
jgi:UPF0716 protein FxsA